MDIEYQDIISVTTFKAAAGRSVTHACVSSMRPAAEESSPVQRSSSSYPFLAWLPAWYTLKIKNFTLRSSPELNHANTRHIKTDVKSEKYLPEVAFFNLLLFCYMLYKCVQDIHTELFLVGNFMVR